MLAAAVLVVLAPPLPTVEDVNKKLHQEARELRNYVDAWEVDARGLEGMSKIQLERKIDGKRVRFSATVDGTLQFLVGSTGDETRVVVPQQKITVIGPGNSDYSKSVADVIGKFEDSFALRLEPYDLLAFTNPKPMVKSFEEADLNGQKARKLTAESTHSRGKLTLTYWLEPDRWRLMKLSIEVGEKEPLPISIVAVRKRLETKTLTTDDFVIARELYDGYEEITPPSFR